MKLFITFDANWEAKLDKVLTAINATGYKQLFEKYNYGKSINGIGIILMCRDPALNFKQRIRFLKKEKELYIDIMLDFHHFLIIEQKEKEKIIANKIISEVPLIIAKYKFNDFNLEKFEFDLIKFIKKLL